MRAVSFGQRPDLDERWDETVGPAWPEFLLHGSTVNQHWHHLFDDHPAFQLYLIDETTDEVLGVANTLPFAWDGEIEHLPGGVDDVIVLAVAQHAEGIEPTTLSAMQAVVTPGNRGRGLAGVLLHEMRRLAADAGFADLVAPVRPNWKARYPLTPFERYCAWTREDGLPYDPWLRTHVRAGARFAVPAMASQRVDGTIAEWETWTGLAFPDSGDYVVDGALIPVSIDRDADRGTIVEPNYWMRHPIR